MIAHLGRIGKNHLHFLQNAKRLISEVPLEANQPKAMSSFGSLGLSPALVDGLFHEHSVFDPTPVQRAIIPRALQGENLVLAAATGSGKTLAYTLPILQSLVTQEEAGYERKPRKPRALILVPTRELARQVLYSVKLLAHRSKVSSCAVLGGEQYGAQKRVLDRMVDVVVASPGRLKQHQERGHVSLTDVRAVVIDEVDTMLTQGFGPDIKELLKGIGHNQDAQLLLATATLTRAVRALLADVEAGFTVGGQSSQTAKARPLTVVEVEGVHRTLQNVKHEVEDTKGTDKLLVLRRVMQRHSSQSPRTLIFCNSVKSARAVHFSLEEAGVVVGSYHGELNSRERTANMEAFRNGEMQHLVCTDLAARGLDIPAIDHVIMFDFPMNPVDYLHRSGRCGRAGRKGMVTSLLAKRDRVLSAAIQSAIAKGLPLDSLTASKRDYRPGHKLSSVLSQNKKTFGGPNRGKSPNQAKRVRSDQRLRKKQRRA